MSEGFARGRAECPCYHTYHLVLHLLSLFDEALGSSLDIPELAPIPQDRETDCIQHQTPICHGQTSYHVAEQLEGVSGCFCPIAHNGDMRLPVEPPLNEETQVSYAV